MTNKWGLRALITLGVALGLFLVIAFALQVPAVGRSIGSPEACGTCHVMVQEVVTLAHSSHRDLACLECHAARGFLQRPAEELKSATRHIYVFLTDSTPAIIKPLPETRLIIQENCAACHASIIGETKVAEHEITGKLCFDCHREVPHGTPLRN